MPRVLGAIHRTLDEDEAFRDRVRREAERRGDLESMDPAAVLFLERPEGWEDRLAGLVEESRREEAERAEAGDLAEARRRVATLEASLAEARETQRDADDEARRARRDADGAREARAAAEAEARRLAAERAEAVRQLKESEERSARRLDRIRELEAAASADVTDGAELTERPAAGDRPDATPDARDRGGDDVPTPRPSGEDTAGTGDGPPALPSPELAGLVERAADAAADLAESLAGIAASLAGRSDATTGPVPSDDPSGGGRPGDGRSGDMPAADEPFGERQATARRPAVPSPPPRPRAPRRAPRVGRGLVADSADGLAELLSRPGMVALVDGYNVSMQGWGAQPVATQRECLLDLLGVVGSRSAALLQVVFDGSGGGERPSVASPLPVRVHFTEEGVEADDRLLEFVERTAADRDVVVVSSDRRVRAGARERGAAVVSAATLLELGRR